MSPSRWSLRANRAEFVEHITERVGESFGLAPTEGSVDPEGARTRLPHTPHLPHWRRRKKPQPSNDDRATPETTTGASTGRDFTVGQADPANPDGAERTAAAQTDTTADYERHHTDEIVRPMPDEEDRGS